MGHLGISLFLMCLVVLHFTISEINHPFIFHKWMLNFRDEHYLLFNVCQLTQRSRGVAQLWIREWNVGILSHTAAEQADRVGECKSTTPLVTVCMCLQELHFHTA